jgi:PTS system nitrogen regulatory IIA component
MMNTLARQCDVEHILLDVDIQDRQQLFHKIGKYLHQQRGCSATDIAHKLDEREALGSTGMGHCVAIPHARLTGLPEPVAVLVRTSHPIPFDAPDGKPVRIFFVLLVPDHATQIHLQRLADAACFLNERESRTALLACSTVQDVRRVLLEWSVTPA